MIYLHGIGHFHPKNTIDNKFLEDLDIGTSNEWILERVGIKARRTVLDLEYIRKTKNFDIRAAQEASLYTNAQTGALAAKSALENAKLTKDDISLVISGSCTPQHSCPAEACTIAAELGIETLAHDVNSACSSLGAQLHMVMMMDTDSSPDYILLVLPENNTRAIDYQDRNSAVLWGDCSTALIVSKKSPSAIAIKETFMTSSPQGWSKVTFPTYGPFRQEGKTVQTFAIKRSVSIIKHFKEFVPGEHINRIKFIGHQANLLMLNSVCNMTEIKPTQHLFNVDQYGNCGAAGAPSVLSQNINSLKKHDQIILAVVGAGLSWGGQLLEVLDDGL